MFGNSRTLSKPTRGSVAYAVSRTALSIFPGNSGGSGDTQQQRVEIYDADKNSVSTLSGIPNGDSGPRNTNFRGAVRIGQGDQVFLHGGVTTLDYSPSSPLDNFLDQSIHVWDGKAQQWGNTVNIFIPPKKTKTLMIGLIVGGVVLVLLFGGGSVYYIRKKKNRLRRFEEEDRLAKGAVLKNEDELHSERRSNRLNNGGNNSPDMKDNHGSGSGPGTVIATSASTDAGTDRNYELPQQRPAPEHFENYATTGRGASLELYNQNPYQIQAHAHTYAQYPYQELGVMNDGIVARPLTTPRPVHAPQEYPLVDTETAATTTSNFVPPTSRFQSVVTVAGQPVYGKTSTDNDVEQQQTVTVEGPEDTDVNGDLVHLHNLRASLDGFSVSSFSSSSTDLNNNNNRSNLFPSPRDSYLGSRVYSNTSSISFGSAFQPHQYGSSSQGQSPSYMPSPTYSATFSVPDSLPGSDTSTHVQQSHQQRPLMRSSELSFPGDRMEIAPLPGIDMYQHPATTVTTAAVPYPRLEPQGLLNMTLKGTSEAIPLLQPPSQPAPPAPFQTRPSP
ncbi:hypothetical protein BX616_001282 [Lobosporangium transversale]|nr:hypothetical protein BX616_001282 [Lobosporangium transversale]